MFGTVILVFSSELLLVTAELGIIYRILMSGMEITVRNRPSWRLNLTFYDIPEHS